MTFYICYANEDRLQAVRLNNQLKTNGYDTCFVDRGDSIFANDPIESIMHAIEESAHFIILHSENTNASTLSQLEITYARNLKKNILVVKMGRGTISDSIRFELGSSSIITENNMSIAAKQLSRMLRGEN